MKNPSQQSPENLWSDEEIRLGRGSLWVAMAVFCLFVLLPVGSLLLPTLRPASLPGKRSNLVETLKAWEDAAKELPLLENWRRSDQERLTERLHLGNRKVFVGKDGWLYYRPDLETISGKGPYHVEPASVARERSEQVWVGAVPVVKSFAAQLQQRGIRFVFVPVPTKPMVCRSGWAGEFADASQAEMPRDWDRVKADLQEAGVDFVDLVPILMAEKSEEGRFLKQDTHWTPQMMETIARRVALRIRAGDEVATPNATGSETGLSAKSYPVASLNRSASGDLVGMLDLGGKKDVTRLFPLQSVELHRPSFDEGSPRPGEKVESVFVLGDSFVNIFDDTALGFGEGEEGAIGAGFVAHLSAALGGEGKSVGSIAINGGGATGVREAFAAMGAVRLAPIRTVVWVLSARDLFLPELAAKRAGIEWRPVALPALDMTSEEAPSSAPVSDAPTEIVGTLQEVSAIGDPAQTPYASAIYSALFQDEKGQDRLVFLWAFRDRKLEPTASLKTGQRYRLRLMPLEDNVEAARAARLDDLFRPDLELLFAEECVAVE